MPGRQQIEIVIKPDGTVEERVTGVNGPDCEKITESIEKALGEVTKREHMSEYFNNTQTQDDGVVTRT